ncbi:MAG: HAD family hydrolase [Syntrophotaleaceae bacterium]
MNCPPLPPIQAILFDLDGTLLNIEMDAYVSGYVRELARHFSDLASHCRFADTVVAAAFDLLKAEDGGQTMEDLFLSLLEERLGIDARLFRQRLQEFCADGLARLAPLVRPFPMARRILQHCFDNGLQVIIATNPVFPRPVVEARLKWGQLDDFPFDLITSYENCRFCKPHRQYFFDILDSLDLQPRQTIMVGNDTEYDLPAQQAGLKTFLLDTCLLDRHNRSDHADFRGSHRDLLELVRCIVANRRNN